jgi:hypothetical protein
VPWLGWLEYLNALAMFKLGITLVKYLPQVSEGAPDLKRGTGALLAGFASVPWLGWLEYLNARAMSKLGITLVKYLPRVRADQGRASGWAVHRQRSICHVGLPPC